MVLSMKRVINILLVTIILFSLTGTLVNTGYEYSDVGIGRKEYIPKDLPWYPLIVFGDNRPDESGEIYYNQVTYHIRDEIKTINPLAVIGVGDHVWNGYVSQIEYFVDTFKDVPNLWVIAGNHEWNNYPYVCSENREGVEYWRKHVAPDLYYKDDIPGWRIVFLNLRYGYEHWSDMEKWIKNIGFNTDRKLIVVFHEPVYPVQSACDHIKTVQEKLIPILDQYKPAIVLQGHKHCYYEKYRDGTLYIITGGGGAPKCDRYPYHYLYFILKPSGEYVYKPVSASDGSIYVSIKKYNSSSTIEYVFNIVNTKRDIYGDRIDELPVRIKFKINNIEYNLVCMVFQGVSSINVKYYVINHTLDIDLGNVVISREYPPYIYVSGRDEAWIIYSKHYTIITRHEENMSSSDDETNNQTYSKSTVSTMNSRENKYTVSRQTSSSNTYKIILGGIPRENRGDYPLYRSIALILFIFIVVGAIIYFMKSS